MNTKLIIRYSLIIKSLFIATFFLFLSIHGISQVIDISNAAKNERYEFVETVTLHRDYAFTGVGQRLIILSISGSSSPVEVGSIEISGGQVEDIKINKSRAYIAAGGAGLRVMDISEPDNPKEIGFINTSGYTEGVVVGEQYAYVADGGDGLRVIDVSDPARLREVGFATIQGYAFDLEVIGNYAYVAGGGAGLRIVDISNPIHPVEVGGYDTPGYVYGLTLVGNSAYVADGWEGFRVIDVTNPRSPFEIGYYKTPGWAFDIVVKENTAYVADAFAGVRMIDISNRNQPVEIGAYEESVDIHKISVSGNTIYAADRRGGLRSIQASDPNHLMIKSFCKLGNVPEVPVHSNPKYTPKGNAEDPDMQFNMVGQIGGATQAVTVVGNYAFVGVGLRMEILDITNPADLRQVGATVAFPYYVEGVAVIGALAYLAVGEAGLRIVNISDPTNPVEVGAWDSPGYAEGVAVAGNTVYLADGPYGLWMVDVSDPAHPRGIGSAYDMNYAYGVALSDSYAFIAAARAGLLVVDISDPMHPVESGAMNTPGNALGLAVSGNLAYVADGWSGLQIVDITIPQQPIGISSYKTSGSASGVSISGTHAYVADAFKGLRVLDVSDNNYPKEISGFELAYGNAVSVTVVGSLAYVADRNWGLHAINVSDPDHLVEIGSYKVMASVEAVDVAANYAYLVSSGIGLRVVDVTDPKHPKWLGATEIANPNEWRDIKSIAVSGRYAYVGIGGRLFVADVSDPSYPLWIESIELKALVSDLTISNGIVYIADEEGLQLADLSDPTHPSLLGRITLCSGTEQGGLSGITVSGSLAYVAVNEKDGLHIIDVSNPDNPTQIGGSTLFVYTVDVAVADNWAYVLDHGQLYIVDVSNPDELQIASSLYIGDPRRIILSGSTAYIAKGSGGLSVVDVSDPLHPLLLTNFNTLGYSLEITLDNNLVYLADGQNGLVILEQETPVEKIITKSIASKIIVTSADDDGPGTFRECIQNAVCGDTILFDTTIFPPANPVTIKLSIELPPITQGNITIDGSNAGVIIDGDLLAGDDWSGPSGLQLFSNENAVMGLQIINFPSTGVEIEGDSNVIGGDRSIGNRPLGQGNLISGNFVAIGIPAYSNNNIVIGNLMGTDITGTQEFRNRAHCIGLGGFGNIIGKADDRFRNILTSQIQMGPGASGNHIVGNYVGTDITGTISLGNPEGWGISMENGAINNTVSGNLCGSLFTGIAIVGWGSDYNTITGNYVGTDVSGTKSMPNTHGLLLGIFAAFNRIGGTEAGEKNLFSGNTNLGVSINGQGQGNIVLGNMIGTTISGDAALGNSQGIFLSTSNVGTIVEDNLISGNVTGIGVEGDNNFIIGNHIGSDISFTGSVPNTEGISINGEHNILQDNLIANNLADGVRIDQRSFNTIRRNSIYSNAEKGINLTNGGNNMFPSPNITGITRTSVSGNAQPNCTVEIFSDNLSQGKIYEGTTNTDSIGYFKFNSLKELSGPNITSTVTDKNGSTSEFSDPALITAVEHPSIPSTYYLLQNCPNPFNQSTTISYTLLQSGYVTIKIFNLFGQEVATLVNDYRTNGEYEIKWQPENFSSGIYFCKIQAGEYTETKKLILQK